MMRQISACKLVRAKSGAAKVVFAKTVLSLLGTFVCVRIFYCLPASRPPLLHSNAVAMTDGIGMLLAGLKVGNSISSVV